MWGENIFLKFWKLYSHLKIFFVIRILIAAALAFHQFIWWPSVAQSSEICANDSG